MLNSQLIPCVTQIAEQLTQRQWMLVTAESCTGGGVAQMLTELAGSSAWFERGFVTYSNRSKEEMLAVAPELITNHGAVSLEVVAAMAQGALLNSEGQLSLAISGIAGPSGGTVQKPVGTVCFAWVGEGRPTFAEQIKFEGSRTQIREQAVIHALQGTRIQLEQ